ncbi:MAG: Gfo/Idh/MocA family oxidoreductase [Phycisphaeraceae bacterium]|nr:MAG: Gfo/Idh/MocA family oxidoreductase [Phycisphaeraceae bacterium]
MNDRASESLDRRDFLRRASATGAAAAAALYAPSWAFARSRPIPDTIRCAVLGTNSRGEYLAGQFASIPGCEIAYICDPDDYAAAKGVKSALQHQTTEPKTVRDFRRALDDDSVHAVVIATPDHWHAPATLLAMAAGKHVYVEKPCGHNCAEGEMLIRAQAKHPDVVVQMGDQRRSSIPVQEAVSALKGGLIGRAYHAKTWYCRLRGPIGVGKFVPVPSNLDYDLWQGPAPRVPYRDNVIHYNWHWFWNWGTGETCNNATHELDVARWALGCEFPTRVTSSGARHRYQDDWEAWDIQQVGIEYPDRKTIFWEGHSVDDVKQFGRDRGTNIYGDDGMMNIAESSFTVYDHDNKVVEQHGRELEGDVTNTRNPTGDITLAHIINFLDSIRGKAKPNSPIDEGHKSVLLCHMGNVALRTTGAVQLDPATGHIKPGQPRAEKLWGRDYQPGWEPVV